MEKFYNTLTKLEYICRDQLKENDCKEGREYLAAILYGKYCIKKKKTSEEQFNKGFLIATIFWVAFILLTFK